MSRANPGDLVVVCVDKHPTVMAELENWSNQAQAGSGTNDRRPGRRPRLHHVNVASAPAGSR